MHYCARFDQQVQHNTVRRLFGQFVRFVARIKHRITCMYILLRARRQRRRMHDRSEISLSVAGKRLGLWEN